MDDEKKLNDEFEIIDGSEDLTAAGNTDEEQDRRFFTQKKAKRPLLERAFGNNKVIFVVSLIIGIVVWFYVSMYASPEMTRTISDIPVTINYENSTPAALGLEMFGTTNYLVKVTVSGPRYLVSERSLSADDITVSANLSYVNEAGVATLDLKGSLNSSLAANDVRIDSLSMSTITIFFDKKQEKEFTVEPEISTVLTSYTADGFINDLPLSSISKIKVTGPATEVSAIKKVVARATLSEPLSDTATLPGKLKMITDDSNIRYASFENEAEVTVTVPVKKIVDLQTVLDFTSTPIYYTDNPLSVSISPSEVSAAVLVKDIDTVKNYVVGQIDFSKIDNAENEFEFKPDNANATILDDTGFFKVVIYADEFAKKSFDLPVTKDNIRVSGNTDGYVLTPAQDSIKVTIIGPESDIESLDTSGIYLEVEIGDEDLSGGSVTAKCSVKVKSNTTCWGYGEYSLRLKAMHSD